MTTPRRALAEVQGDVAIHNDERREEGLALHVVGRAIFLAAFPARQFPRKDGNVVTVRSFKVWTPRGDAVWCEVSLPEYVALLDELTEGTQLRLAAQLHIATSQGVPRKTYVTLRVRDLERVRL